MSGEENMHKELKEIKSHDRSVWITQPKEVEELLRRREIAFDITRGKFNDSNGNSELAMRAAEAFGRGLFAEHIKEKPEEWNMIDWLESTAGQIFNPLGTGATFTKITEDEARSLMFRCLLHEDSNEEHMASLFTYGFMRGMLLSAFPNGELLMKSDLAKGAPMTEFIFKANATDEDRLERERVKNSFESITKKM